MRSKYRSVKTVRNGVTFDSLKEYNRFCELSLLENTGKIQKLERQFAFELIPAQYVQVPSAEYYTRGKHKGERKIKRVCIEKAVKYVADFTYVEDGETVVEDVKGFKTADYVLKRKLMLYVHGIRVRETR